jgi:CheY-like chemotaxis protein/HPt (histidine-containing phosphotransfer) domain-containing protein
VNREVVLEMLAGSGIRVEVAANGREAVDVFRKSPPKLILMDCLMPELDGFAATAQIRVLESAGESGDRVPIIALTANALRGDREKCLEAGMDDYLAKPFAFGELDEILTRWLPQKASAASPRPRGAPPGEGPPPIARSALERLRSLQRPGGPNLVAKIVGLFLRESTDLLGGLDEAVRRGDTEEIRHAAHRLKSVSAQVGAEDLAAHCQQLESAGRENRLEGAAALLERIRTGHDRASKALHLESGVKS